MANWFDKLRHELTMILLVALFIALAYYTWTLLLPFLRLRQ
jgi:hypothetical protein